MIDDAERADVGSIGSNNILAWKLRGAVGVVTNATARDTDEVATERMPLYFRRPGRGIRPGRNEIESVNRPDRLRRRAGGSRVTWSWPTATASLVVPRAQAEAVALYARKILEGDKKRPARALRAARPAARPFDQISERPQPPRAPAPAVWRSSHALTW